MPARLSCDIAILGAGLAGGLIALALKKKHPGLDVRLVEESDRIGGNHVWSFFASDVDEADRWIVAPLICHGWKRYDIAFPAHRRTLEAAYYSIDSGRLDAVVRASLPQEAIMTGRTVLEAAPGAVMLADGEQIDAGGVIDARGPGDLVLLELGWQKFLGREFSLEQDHGAPRPMVMDATVAQIDGYRFVYCLPFGATRMFVEDTYYSDTPDLAPAALAMRIDAYVTARGWRAERLIREETGVLPVAMGGDFDAYWRSSGDKVAKAGMRAGLFHPTTGYSLPDAVRTAASIATAGDFSGSGLHELTHGLARATWRRRGFYRMLDRMLFKAAEPEERYRILERFYRLDPRLIGRFYAGTSTLADKARLLMGKPPVPIGRAIDAIAAASPRPAARGPA